MVWYEYFVYLLHHGSAQTTHPFQAFVVHNVGLRGWFSLFPSEYTFSITYSDGQGSGFT